ncbi:MAG TPA: peptide chain release factor N(5)-glutamine methyltransferase [Eoetvoesiella sp.]
MANVRELLRASELPRLETQMLLQHVLQVPRVWLISHDTDSLQPEKVDQYHALAQQRLAGQPMAYLLGFREFMGHAFAVSPAVLIPRPETELLVETALDFLNESVNRQPRVLDMGTGSGAIATSIALACPRARVVGTDISGEALALAAENAHRLGARVEFLDGSWYHAVCGQPVFDLIVSNPPYISASDPHLQQGDLRFEPAGALTDGADGLDALRTIVHGASAWLKAGGALWMEHGWDQALAVRGFLQQAGFKQVKSLPDLAGIERISGGYL